MGWLFLMVMGPVVAGIGLVLVWWLVRGRRTGLPAGTVAAFSLLAGAVPLVAGASIRLLAGPLPLILDVPLEFWTWYRDYGFASPLLLGILGLVLVAFPVRARSGRGAADLAPRTAVSFARWWWFVTPAVVLALILALTAAAGLASEPDDDGRYTMYSVDLGGGRGMGTSIYGWFYSVPCLILIALLVTIAVVDLVLISRPPLDLDRERDVQIRTLRTRNVVVLATGALVLHLGLILSSLAGTASLRSQFPTSEGGVSFWTTFAALQPLLNGAASVAAALGFALWAAVALSGIPARRPTGTGARS